MLASSFPAAVTGAESSRHGDGAGIWEELGFGRSAAAPGRCALGAAKPRLRARELKPPWDKRGLGVPAHTQGSSDLQGEAKQKLQLLWRPAGSWHRRAGWGGAGLLSRQDAQFGGFDLHREVSSFLSKPLSLLTLLLYVQKLPPQHFFPFLPSPARTGRAAHRSTPSCR